MSQQAHGETTYPGDPTLTCESVTFACDDTGDEWLSVYDVDDEFAGSVQIRREHAVPIRR